MSAFTLAYHKVRSDAEIGAVAATIGACGARIAWNRSDRYDRAYALVEGADERCAAELRAQCGEAFVDRPIIALAVVPSAPEALRAIRSALAGPGAPAGMRSCEESGAAVLLEWDFERSGVDVVLGVVDVELARFRASRVNALLSPLPLAWSARIAAVGLAAPEIAPNRVLEALIEERHVAG